MNLVDLDRVIIDSIAQTFWKDTWANHHSLAGRRKAPPAPDDVPSSSTIEADQFAYQLEVVNKGMSLLDIYNATTELSPSTFGRYLAEHALGTSSKLTRHCSVWAAGGLKCPKWSSLSLRIGS